MSLVDTLNQREKKDEDDSVQINNQIDETINSSLIQNTSNNVIEVAVYQNDDKQLIMSTTAPTSTLTDELPVRFLILDKLRGHVKGHGTLYVGVRPGKRIVTENIVNDMKQYFIIKKPKET